MIKIEISDRNRKETEYFISIKTQVMQRIKMLITSLSHLRGDPIDLKADGIKSWKAVTVHLLKNLEIDQKAESTAFKKATYSTKLSSYTSKPAVKRKLLAAGINSALNLLEELLAADGDELEALLICPPKQLLAKNSKLLNKHGLNNEKGKIILKLAFDYNTYNEIGSKIRTFFRTSNFITFCPYCNLNETEYIELPGGKTASAHELDHFFSQKDHPLLSYSFYNLVPSCGTCNKTRKKEIAFTEDFHLNPYIRGFNRKMMYEPMLKGDEVINIRIQINATSGSILRKKIFGSSEQVYEKADGTKKNEEGNVNVFGLDSRYKSPHRIKKAQFVLNDLKKMDQGKKVNQPLFNLLKDVDMKKVHEEWYESTIKTPFNPKNFNTDALSKMNRDIHDYYYNKLFTFNAIAS